LLTWRGRTQEKGITQKAQRSKGTDRIMGKTKINKSEDFDRRWAQIYADGKETESIPDKLERRGGHLSNLRTFTGGALTRRRYRRGWILALREEDCAPKL